MKIKFNLVAIFSLSLVACFSCQRAVDTDTTKISIALPGIANSAAKIISVSQIIDQSTKVSVMSSTSPQGESTEQESEAFLDILPTGYDTAANTTQYPINCYLVGITGPELFLQKNSCSTKNTTGQIQQSYKFGTFLGLRPSGAILELEAVPGDNRQILIFGLHSVSAAECKDIANKPSKNSFSRPHLLGTSAAMKFEPGKSIIVPVNLVLPTASTQLDDCEINNDQSKEKLIANTIKIENRNFPFNNLRASLSGSYYNCEPLDVQFINTTNNSRQAVVDQATTFSIAKSGDTSISQIKILTDYNDCLAHANSADSSIVSVVAPAGTSSMRVWIFKNNTPSTVTYIPSLISTSLQAIESYNYSTLSQTSSYDYSSSLPRQLDSTNPECINFKISTRTLFGDIPSTTRLGFYAYASDGQATPTSIGNFYSDSNCTTTAAAYSTTVLADKVEKDIYFKLLPNLTNSFVEIKLASQSSNDGTIEYNQRIQLKQKPTDYIPTVSQFRATIISSFPASASTNFLCMPVDIQALDQNGFLISAAAANAFNIEVDTVGITDLTLASNADCSTTIATINGKYSASFATGSSQLRLYLKTGIGALATTTYGEHQMSIVLNNGIKRTVFFTVRDPNY